MLAEQIRAATDSSQRDAARRTTPSHPPQEHPSPEQSATATLPSPKAAQLTAITCDGVRREDAKKAVREEILARYSSIAYKTCQRTWMTTRTFPIGDAQALSDDDDSNDETKTTTPTTRAYADDDGTKPKR
jgi:hypothetical protein